MRISPAFPILILASLLTAGCASLPSAAPTKGQLEKVQTMSDGRPIEIIDIVNADINAINVMAEKNAAWTFMNFPLRQDEIAVGDKLEITIFEVGYSLFGTNSPSKSEAPNAAGKKLPIYEVPKSGIIKIPFVGRIDVLGKNAVSLSDHIRKRMRGLSQQADVAVTIANGNARTISIAGDITKPGRYEIGSNNRKLLDLLAQAGGATARPADITLRLTRFGRTEQLALNSIKPGDESNLMLRPGDYVELLRDRRSITVVGAAKTVSEVTFESPELSLIEALARAGGPLDNQADASGVFVFREVAAEVDGQATSKPTIYRVNLLDPRSYFLSRKFVMRDKDIILVANARSNEFGKLVKLLNQFTSPIVTADLLTRGN